jgi:flagellar protein FlbD
MIVVTRLNESQFAVNPDLIERIHENPDTTLVMLDGAKYIVVESLADVIELIAAYRARIISMARHLPAEFPEGPAAHRSLGLVRDPGTADEPARSDQNTDGGGNPVQLRPRNT